MFVTSATGTGNLSTWANANGQTGIQAGDAICQALAGAVPLPNAGAYRAWLSDSTHDAYCHVSGFPGTMSNNCGQASLPTTAGPWVRTDLAPFAPTIGLLVDPIYAVYAPPDLDQLANTVTNNFFTATLPDGTYDSSDGSCQDWTSSDSSQPSIGEPSRTSAGWTSAATSPCNEAKALACFESGAGPALPPFTAQGIPAFVTDETGYGDLSGWVGSGATDGVAGADAICRYEASAYGLYAQDRYRAWISDDGLAAASRLTGDGPWVRLDGVGIATSKADLLDGTLFTSIGVTPSGAYFTGSTWTGTDELGAATAQNCGHWAATNGQGDGGYADSVNALWTHGGGAECGNVLAAIYCVCDQTLLFQDGFESGDLTAWSRHVP